MIGLPSGKACSSLLRRPLGSKRVPKPAARMTAFIPGKPGFGEAPGEEEAPRPMLRFMWLWFTMKGPPDRRPSAKNQ